MRDLKEDNEVVWQMLGKKSQRSLFKNIWQMGDGSQHYGLTGDWAHWRW